MKRLLIRGAGCCAIITMLRVAYVVQFLTLHVARVSYSCSLGRFAWPMLYTAFVLLIVFLFPLEAPQLFSGPKFRDENNDERDIYQAIDNSGKNYSGSTRIYPIDAQRVVQFFALRVGHTPYSPRRAPLIVTLFHSVFPLRAGWT